MGFTYCIFQLFPKRTDWEGNEHERTVEDMIKQFPNIRPDFLLQLCYQATRSTSANNIILSFLSFRPQIQNEEGVMSNFYQFFNYLRRDQGIPNQNTKASFNIGKWTDLDY